MCVGLTGPTATGRHEWYLDAPEMTAFIEEVERVRAERHDGHAIVEAVRPLFVDLLADRSWLPDHFMEPSEASGMGSGIGMWLLYRAGDGGLAFSSLVVPAGAATPVHDHLAWGIVGLYRGEQDEAVYRRIDDGSNEPHAEVAVWERRQLVPGDLYELLPETDIHRVRTTSDVTSVSLHLLGNDNGCIVRHRFHPEEHRVEPFISGWLNVPCAEKDRAAD
jgi:3-mercaptopropionate dioxygenase